MTKKKTFTLITLKISSLENVWKSAKKVMYREGSERAPMGEHFFLE